jgi:Tol biopolymer transport system component
LITISPEGKDPFVLDQAAGTSHFIWRDSTNILAWRQPKDRPGFYLFEDKTSKKEIVGQNVMTVNGHVTYLPGNKWLLNDTYPDNDRKQHPFLYHIESGKRVPLGHFTSPSEYKGEWRCDNHPRFSPDGKSVIIDSPHGRDGRQMYLIDVSAIVQE